MMGTNSHVKPGSIINIGRPPISVAPMLGRRCEAILMETSGEERQCGALSMWALPELNRCTHHVPEKVLPIVTKRLRAWESMAAYVWENALKDWPIWKEDLT